MLLIYSGNNTCVGRSGRYLFGRSERRVTFGTTRREAKETSHDL